MTLITDNFEVTIAVILYICFKTYYEITASLLISSLFCLFTNICWINSCRVNFLCQLVLATECLDIWSDIILGVSMRVFLDEINI